METIIAADVPTRQELSELYGSVGWTTYTDDLDRLVRAIAGSTWVVTAREDGRLVGFARALSDGATVAYVQDVLVAPDRHRSGVGGRLLDAMLTRASDVRQVVLLTDAEDGQRAFYEAHGLTEVHDVEPPLRAFVRLA
ncbi:MULTISPECIES: GNAT family N-acetyltransferase [unclassified Curtobacterium]|uniref:GNAT family N-acetyltransferase n=1 Tax=unclassified Curtobacterium TaxID=257496 RepID=UPI00226B8579|nr:MULTISPECIES: GNAT family N-acetyltransferase [unclassified Curtobacterium]